ncbi:Cu(I)-responsive transcriptional regulator [Stenotrophomonas rhizophila]|uniref:Cu(I)-responsive transcriptional regulator n=1 Tax=Stenotrophomonas rhizophila TaxID=216778 RepID=UPI001E2B137B|nr:Cu(I)-responsive transcriptional regulator [Stenotrophomonas rhizophila]MCC7635382.1 Cu(I)-responsive transcriptional regulator [Stenotrophomonas rhizophila]MCC7664389.1 Cu(I)-responsive transcriptional regulator [Stenotrophomonas rhizophila]
MNIGQAAKFSGVSAKMIRYYESIGLIPPATRSEAGYRNYTTQEANSLRFIRRSRDLGFTVEQISELLMLWRDGERTSADVKKVALSHVAELEAKIGELQAMANTLRELANNCHGNNRPDCPIIEELAEHTGSRPRAERPALARKTPRFGMDMPASSRARKASSSTS